MALHKNKIAQSLIQGAIEVIDLIQEADTKLDVYVSLFDAHGIDLTDTNITAGQLAALRTFKTDLDALANGVVATTLKSKDQPSHGTDALN